MQIRWSKIFRNYSMKRNPLILNPRIQQFPLLQVWCKNYIIKLKILFVKLISTKNLNESKTQYAYCYPPITKTSEKICGYCADKYRKPTYTTHLFGWTFYWDSCCKSTKFCTNRISLKIVGYISFLRKGRDANVQTLTRRDRLLFDEMKILWWFHLNKSPFITKQRCLFFYNYGQA